MLKLLFGRILPAGLTIGLLSGALAPLQPALKAFAVAADALAGDASAGGVDMPGPDVGELEIAREGDSKLKTFFARLFAKRGEGTNNSRREIAGLAEKMKQRSDEKAAENTARMGKKAKPEKKKSAGKKKAAAAPEAPVDTPAEPASPPE